MPITKQAFGLLPDNTAIGLFTLSNKQGMQVQITNYGAIVTSIMTPDKKGNLGEVNLGFDNLADYLKPNPHFGGTIGRYGNRIAKGQFTLEGKTYPLVTNNGPNHLHGGTIGFDRVVWSAKMVEKRNIPSLILSYLSKDGEEGYPGNLACQVTFKLTNKNELQIDYQSITDKTTIVNLTNHSYFNLNDGGATSCLDHEVRIFADAFTPIDKNIIPTGEIKSVKRTPFNFLKPRKIGDRIHQNNPQLKFGSGYDHNYVLHAKVGLKKAAKVVGLESGRTLEVFTTEPGMQFYTANFLDGSLVGHNNIRYQRRCAICLETQHFPDSPNQPHFPSTTLKAGETYHSTTVYKFS